MKSEEDEAFDELARKQGMWGGGFPAKRQMAADKLQEPPSEWEGIKAILDEYGLQAIDFVADFKAVLAQPAQEPVGKFAKFTDGIWREVTDGSAGVPLYTTPPQPEPWEKFCDSNCVWTDHHPDCKLAQPAQEPVAYVTGMSFGRFIVEPLNPAMVLPIGMALYAGPA